MSKKNKHKHEKLAGRAGEKTGGGKSGPVISARGKKIIAAGAAAVVTGFVVLSFADPIGRNFAAHLSPFIIIGGYMAIGAGIILPDKISDSGTDKAESAMSSAK